ncbi:hypothetical protein BDV96DRAFT_576669 [Lophiotrema nucula]|uniref:Uncharacterized protein n=1 Tax=Lophiotrema nucula TaxID=690887 RepID=A0A6A5Z5R1_9PLEO|nr:hypothetical protein BDV96DRAFT_576669 [Lophiotrema nucula]
MAASNPQQDLVDIRTLSLEERMSLRGEPFVDIRLCGRTFKQIPRRLLLAMSTDAQHLPAQVPDFEAFDLPLGVDERSIVDIVNWINLFTRGDTNGFLSPKGQFEGDIKLCVAANAFGMRLYAEHVAGKRWASLKNGKLTPAQYDIIDRVALSSHDPFVKTMAFQLAKEKKFGSLQDNAEFDDWLDLHPKTATAVATHLQQMETSQQRRWDQERRRQQEENRRRLELGAARKAENDKKRQEEKVKKQLYSKTAQSGVKTVSQEEAALLRLRR